MLVGFLLQEVTDLFQRIAEIIQTDSVEHDCERIMLAFGDLEGKGFFAIFAKIELDLFQFLLSKTPFLEAGGEAIGAFDGISHGFDLTNGRGRNNTSL